MLRNICVWHFSPSLVHRADIVVKAAALYSGMLQGTDGPSGKRNSPIKISWPNAPSVLLLQIWTLLSKATTPPPLHTPGTHLHLDTKSHINKCFHSHEQKEVLRWREIVAASRVSMKAAHLLTARWVNSTPVWVCMFSHWPTELFHFVPSEDLCCGQIHSKECTHDNTHAESWPHIHS